MRLVWIEKVGGTWAYLSDVVWIGWRVVEPKRGWHFAWVRKVDVAAAREDYAVVVPSRPVRR